MDWIFLADKANSGPYNMAKDQALLALAAKSNQAILRFYQWSQPTLSVGRTQKLEREIDLEACRRLNIPLVRRATGGQAVLHGYDLTYSVSAPLNLPLLGTGVMGIYGALSQIFVKFFSELKLEPTIMRYSGRQRVSQGSAICFAVPSAFEIMIGGKKLVGSAQRQTPKAFLQHGSIPLAPQADMLRLLFKRSPATDLSEKMTDLTTLGILPGISLEQLQNRLLKCFALQWNQDPAENVWNDEIEAETGHLISEFPEITPPPSPSAP